MRNFCARGSQLQKILCKISLFFKISKVLGEISDFKIIESGVYLITWSSISRDIWRFIVRSYNKKPYKVVRHSTTFCCNFMVNKRTIYGIYSKFFQISRSAEIWDFNKDFKKALRDFKELQTPCFCDLFITINGIEPK